MPLIDSAVKSGTGNEREKSWGVDRRNDIGPDSNPCPPWASSPNVVGATACATVPPTSSLHSAGSMCPHCPPYSGNSIQTPLHFSLFVSLQPFAKIEQVHFFSH